MLRRFQFVLCQVYFKHDSLGLSSPSTEMLATVVLLPSLQAVDSTLLNWLIVSLTTTEQNPEQKTNQLLNKPEILNQLQTLKLAKTHHNLQVVQDNLGNFGQLTARGQHAKYGIFLFTCQPPGSVNFNKTRISDVTQPYLLVLVDDIQQHLG